MSDDLKDILRITPAMKKQLVEALIEKLQHRMKCRELIKKGVRIQWDVKPDGEKP